VAFAGGRYEVKRFLGEGGRKRVFLARDTRLDRDVAVAIIKTEGLDEAGLSRVKREAQAMARLGDHPHIVTIHDIGEENGQPYIVSQYMAGGELTDLLKEAENRRLSLNEALRISNEVRLALEHAHGKGIIHRDLKPANIWLTQDGTAKLGDFGLAVALDRSRLTLEGTMVGTVAYMPPEQALGRQPDARSDLYSLGCVLYEMLTGRPPFLGDDNVAIISQHINTPPVAPTWHNPEIPKALESLIMRCLAKNPDERPESAAAIPDALLAIAETASKVAEHASEQAAVNPLDRLAGGVFVGRETEMDELRAGLEDSLSGRGRLLMLVGEPGIGKTRTSEELATYAALRSARVLWGKCYEGEGAPAYWPWVQLVRSYVFDRDPKELMSEMGPGAADIAEVVPEVRERLPGLPAPPQLEPEQARFRLFDSITTFLKNASQRQPHVLVLDDLHWADKPSLLLLQFMARELRGSRLLVLGTYRDVELRRAHPLSQTLAELTREGLSQRILLRGLTERDVARFIEITAGIQPPETLVQAVYRETEGNPFFVNEIVRLLVTDGRLEHPETVTTWSVTIPQGVREVIGRRLDHLSEACNQVLTMGSVIGRDFGLRTLEQVSELSRDELLEVLEEAMRARVIAEVPNRVELYTFTHALIKETLYEELSTARRVRAHRRIGEVLEEQHKDDLDSQVAALAYHFAEAAQGGDVDKAINYATRAAERAMSQLAYEESAGHYERALQVIESREPLDERAVAELQIALAEALSKAADLERALDVAEAAFKIGGKLGEPSLLARAALVYGDASFLGIARPNTSQLLKDALAAQSADEERFRALLLAMLPMADFSFESTETKVAYAREAGRIADKIGDPDVKAAAINGMHWALWGPETVQERLEAASELIALAERIEDKRQVVLGYTWRITDLLELGDVEAAYADIEAFQGLADELRQPTYHWWIAWWRAMRPLLEGRLTEAEPLIFQAFAQGQRAQAGAAAGIFGAQLVSLRWMQGRLGEMEKPVRDLVAEQPQVPAWRCVLALILAETGQVQHAQVEVDQLAATGFEFPVDANWLVALALLGDVCGTLENERHAQALFDLLSPYAERCVVAGAGIACLGPASRQLGGLAALMGPWEESERYFQHSLEMNAKIGARPMVVMTQYGYARMLVRRGGPGDRAKALGLLTHALDSAQEMGMRLMVERCLALKLELQGVSSTNTGASIDAVASLVYAEKPDLRRQAAPDGTVTILFSDIQGSTAKTEQLGDTKWMEVLREHNAVVREQLKAHGGFEVKSEGDGFMLAFQSARKALQCAIETQRAFARRNESAEEPVLVRMGLHTGEVIKEGDDFFGKHVNLAARIAGQASGGEILVSSLLKELTASGGDIAFDDGREVTLKGLSGEHLVYAVSWA
jgi:class 3 adenylate cyclase